MRTSPFPVSLRILLLTLLCFSIIRQGEAQSTPKERRITHREKSLRSYNPFIADEIWKRVKIPPSPPLTPEQALASFEMAPGFRIECVASEPLVVDPVMFEFDADGRIWAVEMRGWMRDIEGTGEGDPIGKVVVLEDTDGDTIMDKSTVFLDKLVMPRTVSFVKGGVLIAEPPSLWFCEDTDGDLKCDRKTKVADWGRAGNPEHTENGLMHAIDNWMYNAKSTARHKFVDGELIAEKTIFRGQWGITQDDYGRLFYGYENSSLHGDLLPAEYVLRNRHIGGRSSYGLNTKVSVNAQEVFPIRVTPGITLGGTELRDDGTLRTFTIACGPSIYRGDQFPEKYRGSAVIPEAAGNLVRLDRMFGDGVEIETKNAFDQRELLASTDERFRPVYSRTGPDGALYVGDLYRGIIEHVIFMMPYLKHQILSRGLDKPIGMGRIYRITHEGKPLGKIPQMSGQISAELVAHLSHPNGWWRDTAQRLLVERQAVEVTEQLRELATGGSNHLGRMHALWTLEGIGKLNWETVSEGIGDQDAMVRSTAIRLSERFLDSANREAVFGRLRTAFADDRPTVQLQLLLTLGEVKEEFAETQMVRILNHHPGAVFGTAIVSGLEGRELEFIARLLNGENWSGEKEGKSPVLKTLATAVLNESDDVRVGRLFDFAAGQAEKQAWRTDALLSGILDSKRSRSKWPTPFRLEVRPELLDTLTNSSNGNWKKSAARLHRIVTWPGDEHPHPQRPVPKPLTAAQEQQRIAGEAVYNATCFACHKANGRGLAGQAPPLADSDWVNGPPDRLVKIALHGIHGPIKVNGREWNLAMPGMGNSPILNDDRLAALLTYIRREWENYGEAVDSKLVAAVRSQTQGRATPWSAEELFNPGLTSKNEVAAPADPLAKYRDALKSGDAKRGEKLFHTNLSLRCNACHKVGKTGGGFIGPDLSDIGGRAGDDEYLLESLIVPNKKIVEGFQTMVITTRDGKFQAGTLVSEDDEKVVLALMAGGEISVPVAEIKERVLSPVSTMPPVGAIFSVQEIADLVAYLKSLKESRK